VEVAKRDMLYIGAIMCEREQYSEDLFVMSLRVDDFLQPHGRLTLFLRCFVCDAVPIVAWRPYARLVYEATGLHCEAHAAEFHAVSVNRSICCMPHYHPDNEYAWRAEGRECLARMEEVKFESVTSSPTSSHH
jgi:hypothetical protein